jgi:hypothetical protein
MMSRVPAPRRAEWLLALVSVLFALLVLETALRIVGLGAPAPTGYRPVNTNRRAMRPQNSHGYRDLERRIPPCPGVHTVLSLGDSFAWGASVEFEDAYPQRLERALERRRHEPWQVVNLAMPGMNTVDQEAQFVQEGMDYRPGVALLGFVLNDSEDETAAEARRASDWVEERRSAQPHALDFSIVARMIRGRIGATLENRRRIQGYRSMYADDAPGWIASQKAMRHIGALCKERGVPFVVAIFPLFGNPLDERYPFPEVHQKVARVAADAGARVVDLLPEYRGLRWEILVVNGADDEHPNEIAHRIAAGALLKAVDEIVPRRQPAGPEPAPTPAPCPAVAATP